MYQMAPRKEYAAAVEADADKVLAKVAKRAQAAGVDCTTRHALTHLPWDAILTAAKKNKCDAIVMGSHGRTGVVALLLGSQTQKVLAQTKLPVRDGATTHERAATELSLRQR